MSLHELAGPRQPYESCIRRQDAADLDHRTLEHVACYASEEDRSELGTHV